MAHGTGRPGEAVETVALYILRRELRSSPDLVLAPLEGTKAADAAKPSLASFSVATEVGPFAYDKDGLHVTVRLEVRSVAEGRLMGVVEKNVTKSDVKVSSPGDEDVLLELALKRASEELRGPEACSSRRRIASSRAEPVAPGAVTRFACLSLLSRASPHRSGPPGGRRARSRAPSSLVLEAPPGAGKTTRVPRALLDAGLPAAEIVVLEPRRLAARLAARRVAEELGERVGETVGYQVRFEDVVERPDAHPLRDRGRAHAAAARRSARCAASAAVVLDEFHERHLDGDVALALLPAAAARDAARSARSS